MKINMDYKFLKEKIFSFIDFTYEGEIEFCEQEGVYAALKGGKALIGADTKACLCRALSEFAFAVKSGKKEFEISKKVRFPYCGNMLDMSRDGVLTVESVKRYVDICAAFGLNMIMLYMEDVFELPDYPFFGYKRGKYTIEEIREMDDYADSIGVEMIPCIETLGHLDKYLPWSEATPVRDTLFNIMPGTDESARLVEAMIDFCRKAFRSKKIHIGMDEVSELGLGTYYKKHCNEVIDQDKLFMDHLNMVAKICDKYDFEPMIWSDFMFKDESTREIFTYDSIISDTIKYRLPKNVRLMFWYYSSTTERRYATMLCRHRETGNKTAFGGSGWNWEGFAPNHRLVFETNIPALDACLKDGTELVLNTLWASDGCETSFFLTFPSTALYADYCYNGENASEESTWNFFEFVMKTPREVYKAMDTLTYGLPGNVILGRKLLRMDPLFCPTKLGSVMEQNLPMEVFKEGEPIGKMRESAKYIRNFLAENGDKYEYFTLEALALETASDKAELFLKLPKAYKENDREDLLYIKNILLPKIKAGYEELYDTFRLQWKREYKAFGWETHCRFKGFLLTRIDYAREVLGDYLRGEITTIEELDEPWLNQDFIEYDTKMYL